MSSNPQRTTLDELQTAMLWATCAVSTAVIFATVVHFVFGGMAPAAKVAFGSVMALTPACYVTALVRTFYGISPASAGHLLASIVVMGFGFELIRHCDAEAWSAAVGSLLFVSGWTMVIEILTSRMRIGCRYLVALTGAFVLSSTTLTLPPSALVKTWTEGMAIAFALSFLLLAPIPPSDLSVLSD